MQANKIKKIVASVLIFSQLSFWPSLVFAQIANPAAALNPVPINNNGSLVANNTFNTALIPIQATNAACNVAEKTFESTDNAASLGFSFSAIIGGGGQLATQLSAEMGAYQIYLTCEQGVLTTLNALLSPNSYTDGIKQQMASQVNASIQTYKTKLAQATARFNVASQNIWKALMITVLINITKSVADQLVNKLVSNYKIANLKQYTNSVATLMYDNQFIRDNFPASQDQLMARAILTNPLLRTQIQPGIFVAANNNLGFNPTTLSPTSPNYYNQMAAVGSSQANPYFLQASYVGGVDQSHSAAMNTAQTQISQGSGYKAPVNCAGSLAQQQQIDQQSKAASDQLANRQALLANLQQAQAAGQTVSAGDLAKAQSDYNSALAAWNNIPNTVTGSNASVSNLAGQSATSTFGAIGGANTEGAAAIVMCEAISSPAVLVNQGIDAVFKSLNLGQYNNSNLPGFLSSISSIATQIGSSLVLGGIGAAPSSAVNVSENLAINNGIAAIGSAAIQTANDNSQANLANGIVLNAPVPIAGTPNLYSISWEIVTEQLTTASYVTLTGPGISGATSHMPLTGTYNITTATGGTYLMTVYNAKGQAITSATTSLSTGSGQLSDNSNSNPNLPTVAGAFTSEPAIDVRGPVLSLDTRGPQQ